MSCRGRGTLDLTEQRALSSNLLTPESSWSLALWENPSKILFVGSWGPREMDAISSVGCRKASRPRSFYFFRFYGSGLLVQVYFVPPLVLQQLGWRVSGLPFALLVTL